MSEKVPVVESVKEDQESVALQEQELVHGGDLELRQGWEQEQVLVRGASGTEGAHREVPLEVRGVGQCKAEVEVVAGEAVVQGRDSLAGRSQQEGSRVAGVAFHSPLEAVRNLVVTASCCSSD